MKDRFCIGLLLAAVLLVYGNSLLNDFTYDDSYYIVGNSQVTKPTALGLLKPNSFTKVFRPLTFASFALDWALGGGRPLFFHIFNLILHAGVTLLLYVLLQALLDKRRPRGPASDAALSESENKVVAFAAALLFAIHPIHVEAVSSIVGRSELLAAGFLLAAWIFHIRDRHILAMICFVLALLSKESAAVFLPLVLIVDYARGRWQSISRYVLVSGIALLYVGLLWKMQGGHFGQGVPLSPLDNPLATIAGKWRVLNALRVGWKYVGLHLYPATLSCDYSFNAIPIYFDWRHTLPAAFGALCVAAAWIWTIYRGQISPAVAGSLYLVGFATTANVLIPIGTIMGERLAYLPSAGFCLFVALSWNWLRKRRRMAAWAALTAIVAVLSIRTIVRNRDWKDNLTLFSADVRSVPESAKIHEHLAGTYMEKGQLEMAAAEFETSLRIDPNNPFGLSTYGLLQSWKGNEQVAAQSMERALIMAQKDSPSYDFIAVNYAALLIQTNRMDAALDILNRDIAQSPSYSRAWSNRAVIRYKKREPASARADAETALRLDPDNRQAQNLIRALGADKGSALQR